MTFVVDICAMVFAQPRALFPAVAGGFFGGGVGTVGLLQAAPAIGSLVASPSRVGEQGPPAGGGDRRLRDRYGASVAAFGFARGCGSACRSSREWAADMVSAAYRSTILQTAAPDNLRGRLQGVFTVVVAGGPRMGDFVEGHGGADHADFRVGRRGSGLHRWGAHRDGPRAPGFAHYGASATHPLTRSLVWASSLSASVALRRLNVACWPVECGLAARCIVACRLVDCGLPAC